MNREIKFRCWDKKEEKYLGIETIKSMRNMKLTSFKAEWLDDQMIFEQYTGLKDKNRRDIYEGDIVQYKDEQGIIDVRQGGFYIIYINEDDFGLLQGFKNGELQIIGNQFENKELLK